MGYNMFHRRTGRLGSLRSSHRIRCNVSCDSREKKREEKKRREETRNRLLPFFSLMCDRYPEGQMVIPKLLDTARALLAGKSPTIKEWCWTVVPGNPDGHFIISYVPRRKETTDALFQYIKEKRWNVDQIAWKEFLSQPPPLDAMLLVMKPL